MFGSVVITESLLIDARGGTGETTGGDGRFLFGSNTAVSLGGSDILATPEVFEGPRASNPFIADGSPTPYLPSLEDGAEVFGMTGLDAREVLFQ